MRAAASHTSVFPSKPVSLVWYPMPFPFACIPWKRNEHTSVFPSKPVSLLRKTKKRYVLCTTFEALSSILSVRAAVIFSVKIFFVLLKDTTLKKTLKKKGKQHTKKKITTLFKSLICCEGCAEHVSLLGFTKKRYQT